MSEDKDRYVKKNQNKQLLITINKNNTTSIYVEEQLYRIVVYL